MTNEGSLPVVMNVVVGRRDPSATMRDIKKAVITDIRWKCQDIILAFFVKQYLLVLWRKSCGISSLTSTRTRDQPTLS